MEKQKKVKSIVGIIIAFILGVAGYGGYQSLGATPWYASSEVLVGSSGDFGLKIASSTAYADSVAATTLTSAVDQLVDTAKIEDVLLNIKARGGTATSTLYIRQMGSQDGTDYYDIGISTSTDLYHGTSTIDVLPKIYTLDPGTATTSISFRTNTYGYRFTRFLIWGEDVQADPADGTYAFIQAVRIEPSMR